jgi:hypothetical protein
MEISNEIPLYNEYMKIKTFSKDIILGGPETWAGM